MTDNGDFLDVDQPGQVPTFIVDSIPAQLNQNPIYQAVSILSSSSSSMSSSKIEATTPKPVSILASSSSSSKIDKSNQKQKGQIMLETLEHDLFQVINIILSLTCSFVKE